MINNKRVYLVNPPADIIVLRDMYSSTISKGLYNWPPADLLVTSGILKDKFDIILKDANTEGLTHDETICEIEKFNPDFVFSTFGNSVRDNDYSFLKKVKDNIPNVKIIGSGGILLHNGLKELEAHNYIDATCLNFASKDTTAYINKDYNNLRNYICRIEGKIIKFEKRTLENDFSYDTPLHQMLPLKKYNLSHGRYKPVTSVLTSFGCPGRCTFCISEKIPYKYRNVDNVIEELEFVKNLGVKEIFFRDPAFGSNPKKTKELLDKMIKRDFKFSWVADSRIDTLNEDMINKMSGSGCHALHLGVESANEKILEEYNKRMTLDEVRKVFKLCKKYKIRTVGYFILGLPGETKDDVLKTIDFAIELDSDYASFNFPIPIIGTTLRNVSEEKGWINPDSNLVYDGSLFNVIETEKLSRKEILKLGSYAKKKYYIRPGYIFKRLFGISSFKEFNTMMKEALILVKGIFNKTSA